MHLSEDSKTQIVEAVKAYASDKGLTHSDTGNIHGTRLAKFLEISVSYMSYILNDKWNEIKAGEKTIQLADHHFLKMADKVGYKLEERVWQHFDSHNYMATYNFIEYCREKKALGIVDAETGSGKTYASEQYQRENPVGTYLVTCDGFMAATQFGLSLNKLVGGFQPRNLYQMVQNIEEQLSDMSAKGIDPIIIIDEAENLKPKAYEAIKAICDRLLGKVAIVLIGANDYAPWLKSRAAKRMACFPQIWSRFKGNIKYLHRLNKAELVEVCKQLNINDVAIHNYLMALTDNWRDLSNHIEKIFDEHFETQEPITLGLVKRIFDK
jgi:DNA transposition AAA+ family ATPase